MKPLRALALLAALSFGCSTEDGTGPVSGTGGAAGKGGGSGTGGAATTGGSLATGGSSATGGRTGSGGSSNTGGGPGGAGGSASGGSAGAATGGTAGKGGSGSGGSAGAGGLAGAGGFDAGTADGSRAEVSADSADTSSPSDGSADAQADATSQADSNVYRPCPTNGDPCKIMPLGDSITWGVGDEGNGGYRGPLFALAVAAQQKITFTGSQSNGPNTVSGQTFPKKNEGHSGWTIAQIMNLVNQNPSPPFSSGSGGTPHIILLMIGTNDVYAASGQSEMAKRLESLVNALITKAPDALIVVAKITAMRIGGGYPSVVTPYNDAIPPLVQKLAASGKHVVLGDMNGDFNTATMLVNDGLHPNTAGYKFMADRWYSVIGTYLPK